MLMLEKEIACFSYDDNHEFRLDESSLKYYYTPQIGVSLCAVCARTPSDVNLSIRSRTRKGYDKFKKIDEVADEHLDGLVKTIEDYERRESKRIDADLVTWRGMITKVSHTSG